MTQECSQWHAHQIGKGHTGTHHSNRTCTLALFGNLDCNNGARSEVGSMRQTLNESGTEQQLEAWSYRCYDSTDGDKRGEEHQYILRSILMHQYQREGSCTYDQSINRNKMSHLWNRDVHVVSNIGKNSFNNKFSHAQGECT